MAPTHLLIGVSISFCEHQDTSVGCEIVNTLGIKNPGLGGTGVGCVQGDASARSATPWLCGHRPVSFPLWAPVSSSLKLKKKKKIGVGRFQGSCCLENVRFCVCESSASSVVSS